MGISEVVEVGPWGGRGGEYTYKFKPKGTITHVYIRTGGRGNCIDSIQFSFRDPSGHEGYSQRFGGNGGHLSQSMYLEDGEEIIEFGGTAGNYNGNTVLTSLYFRTNMKKCEFGSVCGNRFSLPVKTKTGKFVGFHGRYGEYLDSIGATLAPK